MKCKVCGKELNSDSYIMLTEYDEPICNECYHEGFKKCKECGAVIKNEKDYCDECTKKIFKNIINSYNTKVKTIFVNRKDNNKNNIGDRYYGMEMEFSYSNPIVARVIFSDEYKNGYIYNKSDSSLYGNGVEIVTVPMTKNRLLDLIDRMNFEEFIKQHPTPENLSNNAGVHIHVSRNTISPFDITKLSFLLNGTSSKPYRNIMYYLCGRAKDTDAKLIDDDYYRVGTTPLLYIKDNDYTASHCVALNLGNKNTIEFRLFKGSSNKDELKSYIDIVYNMIEFVENNPLRNINIPNFLTYLSLKTESNLLKEKLSMISENKKDCIGYRENKFNINNIIKFPEECSLADKCKIMMNLLYTNPKDVDWSKTITLDMSKHLLECSKYVDINERIQICLKYFRNKLVENILTNV